MEKSIKEKTEVIVAAAGKAPKSLKPYIEKAAPVIALTLTLLSYLLPYVVKFYGLGFKVYELLLPYHPEDFVEVFVGVFLCFFGGMYPALITAAEAYRQIGWEPTYKALKILYADYEKVSEECAKDDKVDADKDGIADVKQISPTELVERKLLIVLKTTDPEVTTDAMAAISSGWLAVMASLRISFAKALTLGSAIGDVLRRPAVRLGAPVLKKMIPEDYQKWVVPVITYTCKAVAVSIAWTLQRIISAFHSAIRGGEMAGKGLVKYLKKHGYLKADVNDTYMDELVGYGLMVAGFLVQITSGFSLPFPLNLILLPFSICESVVVWLIMD